MSTDLSQYQTLFIQTSTELVDSMNNQLKILEKDLRNEKAIGDFHRTAHSLKSQSLVMGFSQLGAINKELEELFRSVKETKMELTNEDIKMLFQIVKHIKHAISDIEKSENEPDLTHDIQMLQMHTNI